MNTTTQQDWADITIEWEKTQKHTGWRRPDLYFPEYYKSNNGWAKQSKWHVLNKRRLWRKEAKAINTLTS